MKRTIQSPTAVAAPIEKAPQPASVSLRRARDRFLGHLREAGPVVYRSAGPSRARRARLEDRGPDRNVSPTMMTKHAMSNFAPDPPAKPMHDQTHEPGALFGRKGRDRASDKAPR